MTSGEMKEALEVEWDGQLVRMEEALGHKVRPLVFHHTSVQ